MKIQVLDHGYVELIEYWGRGREATTQPHYDPAIDGECGIIEAARQSTQGSFRGWEAAQCTCPPKHIQASHSPDCPAVKSPGDARLLKFLYNNKHATPFEFAGMIIEVQAPIFVFREWHRHRTQSYNEMSARYSPLPDLYYVPSVERVSLNSSTSNKQAAGQTMLNPKYARVWPSYLSEAYKATETLYQNALAEGIPKELARLIMPVGHYSRMRASANLRNWLAFLTMRMAPQAQYEIHQYANAVDQIIKHCFPRTHKLFSTSGD